MPWRASIVFGPQPLSFDRIGGIQPLLARYGAATAHTPEGNSRLPARAALLDAPMLAPERVRMGFFQQQWQACRIFSPTLARLFRICGTEAPFGLCY
jgi:hypothetical protein